MLAAYHGAVLSATRRCERVCIVSLPDVVLNDRMLHARALLVGLSALTVVAVACDKAKEPPKAAVAAAEEKTDKPVGDEHEGFVITSVTGKGPALLAALETEVTKAKSQGLQPFAEVWAGWCGPCKAIKASLGEPVMVKAFKGTYIIQLDGDVVDLNGTGMSNGVIPVFYELDDSGKPTGREINGGAWGDNVPENMAPPLDAFFHAKS